MTKNFHFKMLIGFSIFAFIMSFIYLSSGLKNSSDRIGTPIGGLFTALGAFSGITAGAIRSINRRLDKSGLEEDPQYPTSGSQTHKKEAQQDVHGNTH
jgi:hypothetical protein